MENRRFAPASGPFQWSGKLLLPSDLRKEHRTEEKLDDLTIKLVETEAEMEGALGVRFRVFVG